jgi:hypothetical protein
MQFNGVMGMGLGILWSVSLNQLVCVEDGRLNANLEH